MNQYNNKDLYQIIGINKSVSQQEIDNLALVKSSKDNTKINKALIVLTDPQKRIEYDEKGWQLKWDNEFEEWLAACSATFKSIHSHMGYGVEAIYHPDGEQVWLMGSDLEPKLWAPFNSPSADANWIDKIYSIKGPNWRSRMKDYENAMLAEIARVRAERQKTPWCKANWEYVDSGNCAKCGEKAKIKDARGEDKNVYCSQKCYYENWENRYNKTEEWKHEQPEHKYINFKDLEYKNLELKLFGCEECRCEGKDVYKRGDGKYRCKKCFDEYLEELKNPSRKNKKTNHLTRCCDNCGEKIKEHEDENGNIISGVGSVDSDGNRHEFCSQECSEKFGKWRTIAVVKKNPFAELLKWMEREGITNISLDPDNGKLTLEYGKNNSKTIEDNNLTSKQREIKNFFQQIGKNSLSQNEARVKAEAEEKSNNDNKWVKPVVIGGLLLAVIILIGVIIYKNKKKGY